MINRVRGYFQDNIKESTWRNAVGAGRGYSMEQGLKATLEQALPWAGRLAVIRIYEDGTFMRRGVTTEGFQEVDKKTDQVVDGLVRSFGLGPDKSRKLALGSLIVRNPVATPLGDEAMHVAGAAREKGIDAWDYGAVSPDVFAHFPRHTSFDNIPPHRIEGLRENLEREYAESGVNLALITHVAADLETKHAEAETTIDAADDAYAVFSSTIRPSLYGASALHLLRPAQGLLLTEVDPEAGRASWELIR